MRNLKFRHFDKRLNDFWVFELLSVGIGWLSDIESFDKDRVDSPIEQFTGLTDKNGVEIYEGDIVHYLYKPSEGWSADAVAVISWKGTGFYIKPISGHCLTCWLVSLPGAGESEKNNPLFEVIGNIHQNPELLEQNK